MATSQSNGGNEDTLSQTSDNNDTTFIKPDGGAMHQCINELSSSLRNNDIQPKPSSPPVERKKSVDSDQESTKSPASHFVTVIEVKETLRTEESVTPPLDEEEKSTTPPEVVPEVMVAEKFVSAPLAAVLEAKKKIPPR